MRQDNKKKSVLFLIAILSVVAVYGFYSQYAVNGSTSTITALKSNNSGSTASVYQAIEVTLTSPPSGTYWVVPASQFKALSLYGYGQSSTQSAPQFSQIASISSYIYFTPTLADSSTVTSWTYQCYVNLTLVNTGTGKTVAVLSNSTPISYGLTSKDETSSNPSILTSGVLTQVVSASLTGANIESSLIPVNLQGVSLTYTETMWDVGLTVHFADGKTAVMSAPSAPNNVLQWQIQGT